MKKRRLTLAIPEMRCDKNCGDCCGIVPVTADELVRVNNYINANGIVPRAQGSTCPFYQKGQCAVYEVRPRICQAFGHTYKMECSRGYNEDIADELIQEWLTDNGTIRGTLHSTLNMLSVIPRARKAG